MADTSENDKVRNIGAVQEDIDQYLAQLLGEKFRDYRNRWEQAERHLHDFGFPLFLVVETINACNLRCAMCFRRTSSGGQAALMSMERYRAILAEAARHQCPSLSLNGNNEPLLDPHLVERVALARQSGFLDIRINTNAMLLTPEKSAALIDAGLTRLSVSLDAASSETYSRVRQGGDWDRVVANVESFLELRKRKGANLPLLRCTFVRISENEHELDNFVRTWQGRADYLSIQSYVPHTPDEAALRLHPTQRSGLPDVTCSQPFERLVINAEGQVFPCCSPLGEELPLGHLDHSSLEQIWHAEKSRCLRSMMKERSWESSPVCRKCLENTFGKS